MGIGMIIGAIALALGVMSCTDEKDTAKTDAAPPSCPPPPSCDVGRENHNLECDSFSKQQTKQPLLNYSSANTVHYLWAFQNSKMTDTSYDAVKEAALEKIQNRPEGLDILSLVGAQKDLLRPACKENDAFKSNTDVKDYVSAETKFWSTYQSRDKRSDDSAVLAVLAAMAPASQKVASFKEALKALAGKVANETDVEGKNTKASVDAFVEILTFARTFNELADKVYTEETRFAAKPKVGKLSSDERKEVQDDVLKLAKAIFKDANKMTDYSDEFKALLDKMTVEQQKLAIGLADGVRGLKKAVSGGTGGPGPKPPPPPTPGKKRPLAR